MTPIQSAMDLNSPAAPAPLTESQAPAPERLVGPTARRGIAPTLPLPPGTGYCHCTACGLTFRSETGFTAHRVGDYSQGRRPRCLTVDELTARGWLPNAAGYWVTKAYDGPERGTE